MAACLVAVEASKVERGTTMAAGRWTPTGRVVDAGESDPFSGLGAISSPVRHADVVELADTRRSGRRARKGVEVRVLSSA
jgi:hypothetical protein